MTPEAKQIGDKNADDGSVPILDTHYDQRTQERKSHQRRQALEANMLQYALTNGGEKRYA